MIALDTNLLVHAHRADASLHAKAKEAVRNLAESRVPWGICYHSLIEFYAVATQPRIWDTPSSTTEAFDQIEAWKESPSLRILCDSEASLEKLRLLATRGNVRGSIVHDARIAACCLSHGVKEIWTVDRDFSRFAELKTRNPLA